MWKSVGRARLCEFYPGICLKTEEKHGKTSVRVRETSVRVRKTSVRLRKTSVRLRKTRVQHTYYQNTHTNTHITKHTHIHTHTHTHTHKHTHITKQYKTGTVQIKTNTLQGVPNETVII
jgi:hypothetical protein